MFLLRQIRDRGRMAGVSPACAPEKPVRFLSKKAACVDETHLLCDALGSGTEFTSQLEGSQCPGGLFVVPRTVLYMSVTFT